jgi:hypothetical protein
MNSRWYNAAVVVAWLGAMSWLMIEKVLPPLRVGEPPSYRQVIEAQSADPPVGWNIALNEHPLGWALTDTKKQPTGLAEIRGRVHFDDFPIAAMSPLWLQPFVAFAKKPSAGLRLDASSTILIDSFGRLFRFDSAIGLPMLADDINMQGTVDGGQLQLTIRSGAQSFTHELSLPPKALVADALSPQTRLPGLYVGQEWSVPIFNPLWPSKSPIEITSAKVEMPDIIMWDEKPANTLVVVYRRDSGAAGKVKQSVQGKLWVRDDGVVLRQESLLFDSSIVFVRMTEKETEKLIKKIGPRWWDFGGGRRGERP